MKKLLIRKMLLAAVCLCVGGVNVDVWAYVVPSGYEIKTVYVGTDNGDGTVAADDFDYESVPAAWVAQSGCALSIGNKTYVANAEVGSTPEEQPTYVNGKSLCTTVSGTNWEYHYGRYTLADAVYNGYLVFRADMYCANSPTVLRFLDESGNELLRLNFNNGSNDRYYQYVVNGGSSASNCDMHTTYRTYHGFSIEDLVINLNTGAVSFWLDYINTNNSNKREQVTLTKNINFGTGKSIKYLELGSIVNSSQSVYFDNIKFYHVGLEGTNYTATFTANDGAITPTVKIYSDSERTLEVTNGELINGTNYYYRATLTGYWPKEGEFTVTGSNPTVSFTMTAKETYTYYFKQKLGSAEATTIESNTLYEDETVTLYYPKYVKSGDAYYVVDANESTPHYGVTLSKTNTTFTVTYSLDADIIYYAEMDDIASGLYNQTNCANYTSRGNARFFQSEKNGKISTSIGIEAAGPYDVFVAAIDRSGKSQSLDLYRKTTGGVETLIGSIKSSTNSYLYPNTFLNVPFAVGEELYSQPYTSSSNATICIDYVTVSKSKVSYTVEYKCNATTIKTPDASRTAVWGTYATLTDDDKIEVVYGGKLYRYSFDNASSQSIASDGTTVITVNFDEVGTVSTITYTLDVTGSDDNDKTSISSTDVSTSTCLTTLVGITNNTGSSYTKGSKANLTVKIPTDASYTDGHYMSVGFTVADGFKFTPTAIIVKAQPVTTNKTLKLVLTDGENSVEKTQTDLAEGTITAVSANFTENTSLMGDVTLKIYCYGATDTYRLGSPITITGAITYADEIINAIDDCKTYETSAAFASHIDGILSDSTLTTTAKVYAAHSAWQIAQANANGSTDYSKAIMNRTFELHNTNGWTIYGDAASNADTDKNKYGEVEYDEGWSQYYTGWNGRNVSQTIASLPAGSYRLTAKVYSWSGGAPVRLFANGTLSNAENGDDHDPVLDFTVTGNETNIKIGIGGVGNNDGTDNTWGTWGYRVKDFTLTKTSVSATISDSGWNTFSSNYALDLSTITNGTAYVATSRGANTVTVTPCTAIVAAGTGLMIKGTAGETFTIGVTADAATLSETNLLVGLPNGGDVAASDNNYVFGWPTGTPSNYGFYYVNSSAASLGAGKAYLHAEGATPGARLTISFDDETTAITDVKGENESVKGSYYDMQGRKVANPTSGLYIVNGRKVIVK